MRQEERSGATRAKIHKAAAACFAEKGYEGCSMDSIAKRAGLSKGALYGHFASKAELFVAIIHHEHGRGEARAMHEAQNPPYVEGIIRFMSQCIRDFGYPMDHRLWIEVLAVAARDPEMKKVFVASERHPRGVLKTLLERAMAAGEIPGDTDPEAMSIMLFSLGDGLIARIADDPGFDFEKNLPTFALVVRRLLGASLPPNLAGEQND